MGKVRSWGLFLFPEIAARCSRMRLHLKVLVSPLPDAYPVGKFPTRIVATAITGLVTRSEVREINDDGADEPEKGERILLSHREIGISSLNRQRHDKWCSGEASP